MTTTTAKWTIEDYHQMIEAGILVNRHVELLNGEIVEMPPEGEHHSVTIYRDGIIAPLAFPDVKLSVQRVLN